MLVDNVSITVKAGNGGNGSMHFLRNAQTRKGGPDGGNGGNGGSVYLQGVDDILGLAQFRFRKELAAEDGISGGGKNLFGRNGDDLTIYLPLGTQVMDIETGQTWQIVDTTRPILIAQGGTGGRGNNEFKTSTNQTPTYAEKGTPGQVRQLQLDLKIIADIGLIGLPNAGKSSLLATLTNANPKIGNYPFTTLEPNLGVLIMQDNKRVVLADIPGLIEGASAGKGLGSEFLRHVEKTKFLVHCIDSSSETITSDYQTIRKELESYSEILAAKQEVILLTKTDLISPEELEKKVQEAKKLNERVYTFSIYTPKETHQQLAALFQSLTQ